MLPHHPYWKLFFTWLWLILISAGSTISLAHDDNVMLLDAQSQDIRVAPYVHHLCIDDFIDQLDQIQQLEFSEWDGGLVNFGYTDKWCWLQFQIQNISNKQATYYLYNPFNFVDRIDIIYQQGRKEHRSIFGDDAAFHEREFPTNQPLSKITLAPNEKLTIYARGKTDNAMVFSLAMYAEKPFFAQVVRDKWLDGGYYGTLYGLLLLALLLFWYFRDVMYLAYFIHVFSMLMLFLNMDGQFMYIWPEYPHITDVAHNLFTYLTTIFAVIFSRYYLSFKDNLYLDKASLLITQSLLFLLCLSPFVDADFNYIATNISTLITVSFLLITCIIQLRRGYQEAGYYLAGWILLLLSTAALNLTIFGARLEIDQLMDVLKYAFLSQQIILFLGLANKIQQLVNEEKDSREKSILTQSTLQARNEFFAKMSHEIRTPINGILGSLELATHSEQNKEKSKYITTAQHSAEALLNIVNDILDFSKLDVGKFELKSNNFHLPTLIEECFAAYEFERERKSLSFHFKIDDDVPHNLYADPVRLRQIILNLLSNAVKYSESGKVTINANIKEKIEDELLIEFSVIDEGKGIQLDNPQSLFEPFTQADQINQTSQPGTGLGLSICKQLTELMGGTIKIISKVNQGTEVKFSIKANVVRQPFSLIEDASSISLKSLDTLTVLVAEDNPVNKTVIEGILKLLNIKFTMTKNGHECIQQYTSSPETYDLILMDCEMPVLDGFEAAQQIRQHEQQNELKQIPIIALSAHAGQNSIDQCLESGMNEHLSKPVSIGKLTDVLSKHIDDKH